MTGKLIRIIYHEVTGSFQTDLGAFLYFSGNLPF